MKIRTGVYTILEGIEMLIQPYYGHGYSDPEIDEHRKISYSEEFGSLAGFTLEKNTSIFSRDIKIIDLDNAFKVETKALYQGFEMNVYNYFENEQAIGLTTHEIIDDPNFMKSMDQFGVDYFIGMIKLSEIDKIWEARTESEFDLPIPEGLELEKIILKDEL